MNRIVAVAVVIMAGFAGGCGMFGRKSSVATSSPNLTPPPPPPAAPQPAPAPAVAAAPATPVTPVSYDPAPLPEARPAASKTYVVKKGDTLWSIAARTYGDGKQYHRIVAANPGIRGEQIKVGQTLTLP